VERIRSNRQPNVDAVFFQQISLPLEYMLFV
jgi:hypothetical protein